MTLCRPADRPTPAMAAVAAAADFVAHLLFNTQSQASQSLFKVG